MMLSYRWNKMNTMSCQTQAQIMFMDDGFSPQLAN